MSTLLLLWLAAGPATPSCTGKTQATCQNLCDEGDAQVCEALGDVQVAGGDSVRQRALVSFERACARRRSTACVKLGEELLAYSQVPGAVTKAEQLLATACAGDVARACAVLGHETWVGSKLDRDPAAAHRLLEKACRLGDAVACGELGELLWRSEGERKDAPRAVGLLERACDGGVSSACLQLGLALTAGGPGVASDAARAVKLLARACADSTTPTACYWLTRAARDGLPGAPRPSEVPGLLKKACDRGVLPACAELGRRPPQPKAPR